MRYYNPNRHPIPLALPGQRSISIPGKTETDLDATDAGCEAVRAAVRRGQLNALPDLDAVPESAPVAPVGVELRFPGEVYELRASPAAPVSVAEVGLQPDEDGEDAASDEVIRG